MSWPSWVQRVWEPSSVPLVDRAEVRKARAGTAEFLLGVIHALGEEGSELHAAGDDRGAAQLAVVCSAVLDAQEYFSGLDA